MAFCSLDEILRPDVRYEGLCVVENGVARVMLWSGVTIMC
jgi:hypothetical protein